MGSRKDNPQDGLENNPGKDGSLFSQEHPYYPDGCLSCPFAGNRLVALFHDLAHKQNCHRCQRVDGVIEDKKARSRKKENEIEYNRLSKDSRYKEVEFDEKTGGVTATHIGHKTHPNTTERFFGTMTGDDLENEIKQLLFHSGHSVIFCDESKVIPHTRQTSNKLQYTALDMVLDGKVMDIASITSYKKGYGYILQKKNHQAIKFNQRPDVNIEADTVCLYFHDPSMFSIDAVRNGINFLREDSMPMVLQHIKCVLKVKNGIRIIDIDI